jgi:uroporphyrinogen-III synthase
MRPLALSGRRILVTRDAERAGALASRLREHGALVVELPAIAIVPPRDASALDAALRALARYDWLLFTSANGVRATRSRLESLGLAERRLPRVATVGSSTAAAFRSSFQGREPALQPPGDFSGGGLAAAFAAEPLDGRRCLLPTSDRARDELARELRSRGAAVDVVVAYRTVAPADLAERLREAVAPGLDLVVLASPSAVENLAATGVLPATMPFAAIGPTTEQAARAAGLSRGVVASPSTAEGLIEAVLAWFGRP